jgi:hypothetical protein
LYYARLIGFDPVDDAYISFRYAVNWARGLGPVFNAGERVEGYTNFLWVTILGGTTWLGVGEPPVVAMVLGTLLALATLVVVWNVARRADIAVPVVALFLIASDGSFALWSVSGLETALFTFLVLSAAASFAREIRYGGLPLSGALFALAAMARPEGLLVFALTVAYQLSSCLASRRGPDRSDAARILLFLAIFGAYFLWRYNYYGFPLPNTFYAKVETDNTEAQIARGIAHLRTFMEVRYGPALPILMAVPLAAAGIARLRRARPKRRPDGESDDEEGRAADFPRGYGLLVVGTYGAYIVYVGGDWSIGRFFVPVLPFAYLLAGDGVNCLLKLWGWAGHRISDWRHALALSAVAVALLLANGYGSSFRGERERYALPWEVRLASQARRAAGEWLRQNAPADALLVVDAAGQIPYYSGLRTIDMFGLTDLFLAHRRVTIGKGVAGHEKSDLTYLLSRQPDYVVIYGSMLDAFPHLLSRVQGWTDNPGHARYLSIYRRR